MVLSYFLSTLPIFTILCHNFSGREIKQKEERKKSLLNSSGGRDRTSGLWVMSPTSYHCSTPRCGFQN